MTNLTRLGNNLADNISKFIGSWTFVLIQTIIIILWILINVHTPFKFDPYPFIFLNLFFSTEAAYATPLILIASIRQATKDNTKANKEAKVMHESNTLVKKINDSLEKLDTDINLDKISLEDHNELKKEVKKIHKDLLEIKRLIKNINS